jgi:hypothetical protein
LWVLSPNIDTPIRIYQGSAFSSQSTPCSIIWHHAIELKDRRAMAKEGSTLVAFGYREKKEMTVVTCAALKDKHGNIIGYVKTDPSGRLRLRDKSGNVQGYYDPKTNRTIDKSGNTVARGNLLTTLLP